MWRSARWKTCTSPRQHGSGWSAAEGGGLTARSKQTADRFAAFREALKAQGCKSTSQRDDIARVFFESRGHLTVEELYRNVKKVNPRIGYATVYRTLKLLKECGLAAESHFQDGEARYECSGAHHDHLICEECGRIEEFEEEEIEKLQGRVADRFGFRITGHRMELYGLCPACRRKSRP